MNPRILKKLCKRADPYIGKLTSLERHLCEGGDTIDTDQKMDRKHWERWSGNFNRYGYFSPKKNTVVYGQMNGYYEPEWEENDAYSHLKQLVEDHFTDWKNWDYESYPQPAIQIKTPSDVFGHADKLLLPVGGET